MIAHASVSTSTTGAIMHAIICRRFHDMSHAIAIATPAAIMPLRLWVALTATSTLTEAVRSTRVRRRMPSIGTSQRKASTIAACTATLPDLWENQGMAGLPGTKGPPARRSSCSATKLHANSQGRKRRYAPAHCSGSLGMPTTRPATTKANNA